MTTFEVSDMTCGHCASTITKAVIATDANAKVSIDLAGHRVDIESAAADSAKLSESITAAGYTPVEIAGTSSAPVAAGSAKRGGCCCA